mmetsp:Transcript_17510/g.41430  ORF Transcript_17510/g.41430 Transcript_17510/m.41430 type:complete len:314 (-) Transcript_17510:82-1023(-)
MDDDVDVVVGGAEQIMRLDDLQALVHHGGTVEGDLGTHIPVGMGGGLGLDGPGILLAHLEQLVLAQVAEGAAAGREDDAAQSPLRHALQALEDGRVLGVGGEHVDPVLLDEGEDDGAAADEGLLVGEGDVLPELDGRDGGLEARRADDAGNDRVGRVDGGDGVDALGTVEDLGHRAGVAGRLEAVGHLFRCLGSLHRHDLGLVLGHLLGHQLGIAPGAQGVDDEVVRAGVDDVERLRPDGARRAQQGQALLERRALEGLLDRLLEGGVRVDGGGRFGQPPLAGARGARDSAIGHGQGRVGVIAATGEAGEGRG